MVTMRLVREDEFAILEPMVRALAAYHGDDSVPDWDGLRGMLWGARALGQAFFLEEAGRPVGYAIVSEYGRFHLGTRAPELVHFYVGEACRGGGLGAGFMALLEAWALSQGYDRIVLTAGTERAQSFYDKVGYEQQPPPVRYRKILA